MRRTSGGYTVIHLRVNVKLADFCRIGGFNGGKYKNYGHLGWDVV
jgi:hypothetical protein